MRADLSALGALALGFLLVAARVGSAVSFVPLPGFRGACPAPRIVLTVGLALALFPFWPVVNQSPGAGLLALWLIAEAGFGLAAGATMAFLGEGFLVAAQVLGLQAGYSYASTIDPASEADSSILQIFAQLVASLLFFVFGMDHHLLRIFARSLETHPPGLWVARLSAVEPVLRLGSEMFSTGLRLAMPVVALLMLVDLSLALLSRVNAQLQLLILAFPAKMLVTLALLAAIAGVYPFLYERAAARAVAALAALAR